MLIFFFRKALGACLAHDAGQQLSGSIDNFRLPWNRQACINRLDAIGVLALNVAGLDAARIALAASGSVFAAFERVLNSQQRLNVRNARMQSDRSRVAVPLSAAVIEQSAQQAALFRQQQQQQQQQQQRRQQQQRQQPAPPPVRK